MTYSEGKIYILKCNITKKIYIGSTIQTLNRRMSEHKCSYKRYEEGKTHYITSHEIIKNNNYCIRLLKLCPSNS